MRVLCVLALLAMSVYHVSACTVQPESVGANACSTVVVSSQDIFTNAVFSITPFNSVLGTLVNVYIVALSATYSPFGSVSTGATSGSSCTAESQVKLLTATSSVDTTVFGTTGDDPWFGETLVGTETRSCYTACTATGPVTGVSFGNDAFEGYQTYTTCTNTPSSFSPTHTGTDAGNGDYGVSSFTSTAGNAEFDTASADYASTWTLTWATANPIYSFSASGGATFTGSITNVLPIGFTIQYDYTVAVSGDPQFAGFQGQQFQIHGVPEEYFALVSTRTFYMNSRFVYLSNGVCNYNDTECFSHPGTYIDQLGFGMPEVQIKLLAGTHAAGMKAYLNGQALNVGARVMLPLSNTTYVHVVSKSRVVVALDDFIFGVSNSDYFFNIAAQLSNADILAAGNTKLVIHTANPAEAAKQIATSYQEFQIHGLLGQTWRNIQWPSKKMIQGEPTDYQVSSLFNSDFPYTQYIAQ